MRRIEKLHNELTEKLKQRPIRLQGLLKKRKETPTEFLKKFFEKWNDEKDTIYADDKSTQTDTGRRRSIGDIFGIVKYYYPDITLEEVTKIIYQDLFAEVPHMRSSYCSTIKKRVFYKGDDNQESNVYDSETEDEFGLVVPQWKRQIRSKS